MNIYDDLMSTIRHAAVVVAVAVLVLSCGDGAVDPDPPPVLPVATTVTVTPASAMLTALGETARFTAEVHDQNGQVMAGAAVAWTTSDASVAAVDASGQVTAAANGSTTITATAGSATGSASVTVVQEVNAVTVTPATDTLFALGGTVRLAAEAADANGHAVGGSAFEWATTDTLVARVDEEGLVTASVEGAVEVTATSAGVTGRALLTVVEHPDRAALEAFYEATGGPGWDNNENWLTDAPLGDWYGITTDANGRVVELDLFFNGLAGRIPPEIGSLTSLEHLTIGYGALEGSTIPLEVTQLHNLQSLSLNGNGLSGRIPPELAKLSGLQHLGLAQNRLTGSIPPELGDMPQLAFLSLSQNALTGEIPPELANLPLYFLALEHNRLTGGR